jgi:serine O-acetyltransferase
VKNKILKAMSLLLIWKNLFAILIYLTNRRNVNMDMERYLRMMPYKKVGVLGLNYLLLHNEPFRSVFVYRMCQKKKWFRAFAWMLPRRLPSVELYGDIDGGVLLFHKMGCVVHPYKAGKNLTIAQGVTIGAGKPNSEGRSSPILGDNVWICTNAVVFGGITVGNNVTIGAGTVLNKSVPDNCTVVGNPARIVKYNGISCDEPLL